MQGQDGTVKVGCSAMPEERAKTIEAQSGKKIIRRYVTDKCSNHFEVESIAHKTLSKYRLMGEWFSCDFEVAVNAVCEAFTVAARFNFEDSKRKQKENEKFAEDMVRAFYPELFEDESSPSDKLDLNRWIPEKKDEGPIKEFLQDMYKSTIEDCGAEEAEEYINLLSKIESVGVTKCKDEIQGVFCDFFYAVDGEVDTYYCDWPQILNLMALTILKNDNSLLASHPTKVSWRDPLPCLTLTNMV